jgi:ribosomal protein L11 methyltransferase
VNYIEVKIPKPKDQFRIDLLISDLGDVGFESFAEDDDVLSAYIPEKDYSPEKLLAISASEDLNDSPEINLIEDRNWNEVWESNYQPVLIDGRCFIRAPFHDADTKAEFNILLNPKMAFGTAHHETTATMISLLLTENVENKDVLDMGCGTGVLAILAKMKGAKQVTAIDNDIWAFENTVENVELNGLADIDVYQGDAKLLSKDDNYDVILANINKNILLKDIAVYAQSLIKSGKLFLSGFYESDLKDISLNCEQNGLKFVFRKSKNNWTAAVFQKQ